MSGSSPTVAAALIGVGGGFVGLTVSGAFTFITLRANRNAAHDQRAWDKRTPLYEQVLTAAQVVRSYRRHEAFDNAVHVLRDCENQVFAYASDKVARGHGRLLQHAEMNVAWQVLSNDAEVLRALIRDELQPSQRTAKRVMRNAKIRRQRTNQRAKDEAREARRLAKEAEQRAASVAAGDALGEGSVAANGGAEVEGGAVS